MWGGHQRSGGRYQGRGECHYHHHVHVGGGDDEDDDDEGGGWAVVTSAPASSSPSSYSYTTSSLTSPPGDSYTTWMAEALATGTSYASSTLPLSSSATTSNPLSPSSTCETRNPNTVGLSSPQSSASTPVSATGAAMSLKMNSVYIDTSPTRTSKPAPTIRSNSLDQLNFQEKRQLIASTLSLSEFLGGGPQKSGKLKNDDGNLGDPTTPATTPSPTTNTSIVTKTASLSLSDIINATKGNKGMGRPARYRVAWFNRGKIFHQTIEVSVHTNGKACGQ